MRAGVYGRRAAPGRPPCVTDRKRVGSFARSPVDEQHEQIFEVDLAVAVDIRRARGTRAPADEHEEQVLEADLVVTVDVAGA